MESRGDYSLWRGVWGRGAPIKGKQSEAEKAILMKSQTSKNCLARIAWQVLPAMRADRGSRQRNRGGAEGRFQYI